MVYPSVISSSHGAGGAYATTYTATLPGSVSAGNLLVVHVVAATADIPGTPSGWTSIASGSPSGSLSFRTVYKTADGSESGAGLVFSSATSASWGYSAVAIAGSGGPPEASGYTASTSAPNPPALTPSWGAADVLWLVMIGESGSRLITAGPSGYTNIYNDFGSSPPSTALYYKTSTASSEDPGALTLNSSTTICAATVGIKYLSVAANLLFFGSNF